MTDNGAERATGGQNGRAIVVPVFNDWASFHQLAVELAKLPGRPRPQLIVVDDGSSESGPDLGALTALGLAGQVLRLRRNVGHQAAIAAGLCHAVGLGGGREIVIMDGDGEDRPADVDVLFERLSKGPVVAAERARRHVALGFRVFYRVYNAMFRLLTGRRLGFGNFCALSGAAAQRVSRMPQLTLHIAATLLLSGLAIQRLPIDRGARYDGQSRMNFVALTTHGLRSIAAFGETVLTRVVIGAFFLAAAGVLVLAVVLVDKLLGYASPGWTTTVAGVVLVVVLQIAMTGLLGLFVILRGQNASQLDSRATASSLIDRIEPFGES